MTNKLTINYENPALIQFRLKKKSFSSFLKLVVVRLLRIVKGISFQVIGAWELIANRYLRDILCKLNENELDNHENYDLSGSKEREAGGRLFSVIRIQPKKHWDGIYRVNEGERIKSLETRRLRTCSWNRKGDNSCERERERKEEKRYVSHCHELMSRVWPVRLLFLTESIVVSVSICEIACAVSQETIHGF